MTERQNVIPHPLNRSRIGAAKAVARGLAAAALSLIGAGGAAAETRQALVIALRGPGQEVGTAATDALTVSQAALAAGFDVRRLENPTALPEAPLASPDVMLIYLSGTGRADGDDTVFDFTSGPMGLGELAARFGAAGRVILVAETCPAVSRPADAPPGVAALAAPRPEGAAMVALSPAPGAVCGPLRLTAALTNALATPGADIATRLRSAGAAVETGPDWTGFAASEAKAQQTDTLIVSAPIRPLGADAMAGGAIRAQPAIVDDGDSGVSIFTAAAPPLTSFPTDRAARPSVQGLPQPSVIVGDQPAADAPPPDNQTLSGTTVGSGFEDRERVRQDDPALFAQLLESGAFDPDSGQVASAIQTELARMDCYAGRVDGVWGNGSRGAVDRYYDEIDAQPPSREADVTLFRALAQRPDVTCPAPAPTPVAAPTTTRRQPATSGSTARSTPTRRAPAASAPARTTQPAARQPARQQPATQPTERRINPGALGTGVFR